ARARRLRRHLGRGDLRLPGHRLPAVSGDPGQGPVRHPGHRAAALALDRGGDDRDRPGLSLDRPADRQVSRALRQPVLVAGLGLGGVLGILAGYFRGWTDAVVRTAADVMMTIPSIAVLVLVASNVRTMTVPLMAVIVAGLAWMYPTRAVRAQTLSLRERAYI